MDISSIIIDVFLVVLGIFIGSWYQKRQEISTKKEYDFSEKENLVTSLIHELELNLESIGQGLGKRNTLRGNEVDWFTSFLFVNTYESILNSGKLTIFTPDMQSALSLIYERINDLNNFSQNSMPPPFKDMYDGNIKAIESLMKALTDTIPMLINELEKELKADKVDEKDPPTPLSL